MPVRQRQPREVAQQITPLLLLAVGLVTTNRSVTFLENEASFLNSAVKSLREILGPFLPGSGATYPHPPLFEVLLHFWLRWTGGNFDYLRIPSILFFLAGLFVVGRASRHFTGPSGGVAAIWAGALWPFGFHYGRLADSYAWPFFLVSGLTLAYLKYLEKSTSARWAALFVFCLGLIWTTYFAWAMLGLLALDLLLQPRGGESPRRLKALAGMAALLAVAFLPFFWAFRNATFQKVVSLHPRVLDSVANRIFSVYSLFVSESVGPWAWFLSIPAGIAILVCLALTAWWAPLAARRFLLYGAVLIVATPLIGILDAKLLLMLSPWILVPVGAGIETAKPKWASYTLAAALLVIGGIGWYGIYARRYYAAPQFLEPWQEVAGETADQIGGGATVIAEHASFRLYLTYLLRVPRTGGQWRFEGLVPDAVPHPQVYLPETWLAAGRPASRKMILIRSGPDPGGNRPIDQAARQLDQACGSISSRLRMRDPGYAWKQRFFPRSGDPLWRIEIREYDCESSNSKQIYQIPAR